MKVNTMDIESLFEKSFAKFPFNSRKKILMPDRFASFQKSWWGFGILYTQAL